MLPESEFILEPLAFPVARPGGLRVRWDFVARGAVVGRVAGSTIVGPDEVLTAGSGLAPTGGGESGATKPGLKPDWDVEDTGPLAGVCGDRVAGVRVTLRQSGKEATFRKPSRSGSRSISEAMMAGSILIDSLVVMEERQRPG